MHCTKIIDNDDSSLSSTASLSTLSSQDSLVTCTAASTSGISQTSRHVTFNDSANVYHEPRHHYIEGEEADLWYTAQDYKQFKSIAASMAKMIDKQASRSFSRVLEKVYQECCAGTQQHDEDAFDEGSPTNKSPMRLMRQLFHGTQRSACVGLEQRSSRTIARNRSQCRRELVFIVYTTQVQQRKENENDWMMMDDDYYLEQMRLQCERVSHRSRVFARILAQARWETDL